MKIKYIEKYKINENYSFIGGYLYTQDNWNLLLNNYYGISIILDNFCIKLILDNNINDDLMFKLYQRGFIIHKRNNLIIKTDVVRPNFFLINLTNNCNLSCKYCFRNIQTKQYDQINNITLEEICKFILNYCEKNKIKNFSIQPWGGEPLLSFNKILYIQEFFNNKNLFPQIIIETNGTLINEEIAKELLKRNIKIGISIDGTDTLHNMQRPLMNGGNSFEKILHGIKCLRNVNYNEFGVISVVTRKNILEIRNILEYFVKELKLHQVKFNLIKRNHFSPESFELSNINNTDIDTFFNNLISKLIELNKEGYQIYERNICDKLLNLISKRNRNICSSQGCKGGYKIISFDGKGDIYPCDVLDNAEVRLGNIYNNSNLIHIIENSIINNSFFAKKEKENCKDCAWFTYCKGGCTASVLYDNNLKIDEMECRVNNILYPKLINIILTKPEVIHYLTNNQIKILRG